MCACCAVLMSPEQYLDYDGGALITGTVYVRMCVSMYVWVFVYVWICVCISNVTATAER